MRVITANGNGIYQCSEITRNELEAKLRAAGPVELRAQHLSKGNYSVVSGGKLAERRHILPGKTFFGAQPKAGVVWGIGKGPQKGRHAPNRPLSPARRATNYAK